MKRPIPRTFSLLAGLALVGVLVAAVPAVGQTSDVWTNTKISDLRRHQQAIPSEAAEHYETAQRYLVTIDRMTKEDRELSPREQKKLDRAFNKATQELRAAIEASPDWIDARMALAAVLYKQGELEPAEAEYEEILSRDPENTRAESYLATVRYELAKKEQMAEDSGGR